MAIREQKPADFDWVTVRARCSSLNMFTILKLDAERNVDTMKALTKAQGSEMPLSMFDHDGRSFGVTRRTYMGEVGVMFSVRNEEIRVDSKGLKVGFTATLTLGDEGECRFLVDGKELDRWQVLRRALEPLFFSRVED